MRRKLIFLVFFLLLAGSGCDAAPALQAPVRPTTPSTSPAAALTLEATSRRVVQALAARDMETVAAYVHPRQGVRFSPYGFVRDEHQLFMAEDLPGLLDSEEVYTWGSYDGSGLPIELAFKAYFDAFVYSADFSRADQVAVNERLGQGNSLNNIQEFYPEGDFVEYYIPGTDEYAGMDWESMRLVFVEEGGTWMLVGVVHDEWTI